MEGRNVLNHDILWKVGNGENIDIWNDPWTPRAKNFKSFRRGNPPPNVNRVSQLMLDNPRRWKSELLN